jgi:acetyl-CoA carboxylase carboxyl transferase subunit beta
VTVHGEAVRVRPARYREQDALVAEWDFSVAGGSFGAADADGFVDACTEAVRLRLPLVSLVASGGTRLQEGMRALVGIPRLALALDRLAVAGLPHLSVAQHPSTGGIWLTVVGGADLRAGVRGATVGFSGPRVVAAMTGAHLRFGATAAAAAGLLDAVVDAGEVDGWIADTLSVLAPDAPVPLTAPAQPMRQRPRSGWDQVLASREADRPDGATLLTSLFDQATPLRGADRSAAACVGRLAGRRIVAVALAADRAGFTHPSAYRLLERAASLAGRLDLALLTLVDLAGADPTAEADGLVPTLLAAMRATLACPAPTLSFVHGAGGSGGALAAAVTDLVGIGEYGWFAALGPEGAAAALRSEPSEATELMAVTPAELLELGFADDLVATEELRSWVANQVDRLRGIEPAKRLAQRRARWGAALPGSPRSAPGAPAR